jgi:hypothetical protein
MKRMCIALLLLPLAAASCQTSNKAIQAAITQTQGAASTNEALIRTATAQSAATKPTVPTETPALTQTTASHAADEAEIRDLVDNFGKRLQAVALQAPDAPQEMQKQYSEFVSPTLLDMWMNGVSKAPGLIESK